MMHVRCLTNLFAFLFLFAVILFNTSTAAHAADPGLYVVTVVINDSGNTWNPSDFSVHVRSGGQDIAGSPTPGKAEPGTYYANAVGNFNVGEDPLGIYVVSYGGDCDSSGNVSISGGESKTCVIINNDQPPRLHVITQVVNDGGGTANPPDFNIHVKIGGADLAGSPTPGEAAPGNLFEVGVGTYVISEDNKNQYVQSFSGDCDINGTVTLAIGDEKSCTIINTFNQSLATTVPRFPNTGAILSNAQVCLNSRNAPWVITVLALVVALVCLIRNRWPMKHKRVNEEE